MKTYRCIRAEHQAYHEFIFYMPPYLRSKWLEFIEKKLPFNDIDTAFKRLKKYFGNGNAAEADYRYRYEYNRQYDKCYNYIKILRKGSNDFLVSLSKILPENKKANLLPLLLNLLRLLEQLNYSDEKQFNQSITSIVRKFSIFVNGIFPSLKRAEHAAMLQPKKLIIQTDTVPKAPPPEFKMHFQKINSFLLKDNFFDAAQEMSQIPSNYRFNLGEYLPESTAIKLRLAMTTNSFFRAARCEKNFPTPGLLEGKKLKPSNRQKQLETEKKEVAPQPKTHR